MLITYSPTPARDNAGETFARLVRHLETNGRTPAEQVRGEWLPAGVPTEAEAGDLLAEFAPAIAPRTAGLLFVRVLCPDGRIEPMGREPHTPAGYARHVAQLADLLRQPVAARLAVAAERQRATGPSGTL